MWGPNLTSATTGSPSARRDPQTPRAPRHGGSSALAPSHPKPPPRALLALLAAAPGSGRLRGSQWSCSPRKNPAGAGEGTCPDAQARCRQLPQHPGGSVPSRWGKEGTQGLTWGTWASPTHPQGIADQGTAAQKVVGKGGLHTPSRCDRDSAAPRPCSSWGAQRGQLPPAPPCQQGHCRPPERLHPQKNTR